ncbi:hypothetical protein CSTAT_13230 (plasmid) [Corynebacterium stationis]|nr:hypothetical protein CSTAT_13230 [Corynebacterium stationis]
MGAGLVVVDYFFRLPASSGDAWSFAPGDARGLFMCIFTMVAARCGYALLVPPLFLLLVAGAICIA